MVGLSHTIVEKAFRRHLRTTVQQEIMRHRLNGAIELLCTTSLTSAEISRRTEFSSPQYFARFFLEQTKYPPAASASATAAPRGNATPSPAPWSEASSILPTTRSRDRYQPGARVATSSSQSKLPLGAAPAYLFAAEMDTFRACEQRCPDDFLFASQTIYLPSPAGCGRLIAHPRWRK